MYHIDYKKKVLLLLPLYKWDDQHMQLEHLTQDTEPVSNRAGI